MSRRTFFSFHYNQDVHRAWNVRNSWLTQQREAAGFFDSSAFERKKRQDSETLKNFLSDELKGCSVTCVLIGEETYKRPWVRYELMRSFQQGRGLLGVRIHSIRNLDQEQGLYGMNPFDYLRTQRIGNSLYWQEKVDGTWTDYFEVPKSDVTNVPWHLGSDTYCTLSGIFPIYDWQLDDGRNKIGSWIEAAARAANR